MTATISKLSPDLKVSSTSNISASSAGRRLAMLFLYQCETDHIYFFSPNHFQSYIAASYQELSDQKRRKIKARARKLSKGAFSQLISLDNTIAYHSMNWSLNRIHAVDRATLRLGTYELLYQPKTPSGVVIFEAVELAKAFGSEDSPRFVHGILGAIAKDPKPYPKISETLTIKASQESFG